MLALAAMAAIGVWTFSQYGFDDEPSSLARDDARPDGGAPSTPDISNVGPRGARANLASFFSNEDYPDAAIREEAQGTVSFRLTVGRDGRVKRCEIMVSGGHPALDETTCQILKSRALFVPARDGEGNRIEDQVTGRIRWVLPEF